MPTIVIKSVAELRQLQRKFRVLRNIFDTVQRLAVDRIANEVVLEEIHARMRQNNFSDKIIDATFVGKTDIVGESSVTHFISNYEADTGFDVSNAREEGTFHPNPTVPKKPGGTLRWEGAGGEIIFRKKSHPKGIERLLIIERTLKANEVKAAEAIGGEISEFAGKFLGV